MSDVSPERCGVPLPYYSVLGGISEASPPPPTSPPLKGMRGFLRLGRWVYFGPDPGIPSTTLPPLAAAPLFVPWNSTRTSLLLPSTALIPTYRPRTRCFPWMQRKSIAVDRSKQKGNPRYSTFESHYVLVLGDDQSFFCKHTQDKCSSHHQLQAAYSFFLSPVQFILSIHSKHTKVNIHAVCDDAMLAIRHSICQMHACSMWELPL